MAQVFGRVADILARSKESQFHLGNHGALLIAGSFCVIGFVGFFAYLYFKEWKDKREFERARRAAYQKQPLITPGDPNRPTLIRCAKSKHSLLNRTPKAPARSSLNSQSANGLGAAKLPGPLRVVEGGSASRIASETRPSAGAEPERGHVSIEVNDENAEIFANGCFVGNAPAMLTLIEGTHSIEIKSGGTVAYRRQIAVTANARLRIRANLDGSPVMIQAGEWQPAEA